jgi:hypothetical protein
MFSFAEAGAFLPNPSQVFRPDSSYDLSVFYQIRQAFRLCLKA